MKLIAASLLTSCLATSAATLSTTEMPAAGFDIVSWNNWKGQEFRIGEIPDESQVISATLRLEFVVANANFVVRIVGSEGSPGRPNMTDVRATFRPLTMTSGTEVGLFTFQTDPQVEYPPMQPNASYWLIAGMTAVDPEESNPAGLVRWHYTAASGQDAGATAGWSVGGLISNSNTEGAQWISAAEAPYQFNLSAVTVPEPGSLMLLLPATALLLRRRKS